MKTSLRYPPSGWFVVGMMFFMATAAADEAREKAIEEDRQRIQGTWRITALTVNGNRAQDEDAQKLTVVNGDDGTWSVRSEGKEISKGTSTFDPTQQPKTIDFTATDGEGKGDKFVGIYELGKQTRRLCIAPAGKNRPTEFSSTPTNQHLLVTFERAKSE